MKSALLALTFVGSVLLAQSVGSRQLGSLDSAQGLYESIIPPGFCVLSGRDPREAQVLDHQTRSTEDASLRLLSYFIDCDQLQQLRAGIVELDRFGYLVTPVEPGGLSAISTARYVDLMAAHIANKDTVSLDEGLQRLAKGAQNVEVGVLRHDRDVIYEGRLSRQSLATGQSGDDVAIALNGYTKLGALPVVITLVLPYEDRESLDHLLEAQQQRISAIAQTN